MNQELILPPDQLNKELAKPITIEEIRARAQLVSRCMAESMIDGVHYGKVPGCGDKPTLLKPGAEKLCFLFGMAPRITKEEIHITELGDGHREYTVIIPFDEINTGKFLGTGVGSCSTMESKYRYRNAERKCPECGAAAIIKGKAEYGGGFVCFKKKGGCGAKFDDNDPAIMDQEVGKIAYDNPADYYNTCLKMAKKRALVDGTLNITGSSDQFTQDIEDMDSITKPEITDPSPSNKAQNVTPKNEKQKPAPATDSEKPDWFKNLSPNAKKEWEFLAKSVVPQYQYVNEKLRKVNLPQFDHEAHLCNSVAQYLHDTHDQHQDANYWWNRFKDWHQAKHEAKSAAANTDPATGELLPDDNLPWSDDMQKELLACFDDNTIKLFLSSFKKAGISIKTDKELLELVKRAAKEAKIGLDLFNSDLVEYGNALIAFKKKIDLAEINKQIPPG